MEYSKLWKKEENRADAQYIKIFDIRQSEFKEKLYRISERKNNSIADDDFRTAELMKTVVNLDSRYWNAVMDKYNSGLRFAEIGSKNVSIAYAKRSECFSYLDMFTKCLNDIDLAKKGNCPKNLLPMLEKRRAECEEKMQSNYELKLLTPKLSFETNKDIPSFADCLEIRNNDEFGYHVVANRDIDVGKTVVVEKSISCTVSGQLEGCATCQKTRMNFIPCEKCSTVLFCNEECKKKNLIHVYECGISTKDLGGIKAHAQTILMAMSTFVSVEELIGFVESMNGEERVMPTSIHDFKSKYQMFLQLHSSFPAPFIPDEYFNVAKKTFIHLMRLRAVKNFFIEEPHQRFLMHLVMKHTIIVMKNGFNTFANKCQIINIINTASSLFNHSCTPNLYNMASDGDQICITLRPIKMGEQLFVAYAIDKDSYPGKRQDNLKNTFGFICHCEKCEPRWKLSDRELMKSSTYYRFMMKNRNKDYLDDKTRALHKFVCEKFLNKYGRLPWCPEMEFITDIYSRNHGFDY